MSRAQRGWGGIIIGLVWVGLAQAATPQQGPIAPAPEVNKRVYSTPTPSAPSGGEGIDAERQYHHCIALARSKPAEGWEESLAWGGLGGGEAARHCGAIALFGLGQYEEAAIRLEGLAQESHRSNRLRAGMLAQAGQGWVMLKDYERANAVLTTALKLVPDAPDLLIDRAEVLGMARNYRDALKDLNRALKSDPRRVDALTYRATAQRFLDDRKAAQADIEAALKLDPHYQDAWLEKGNLARLAGDKATARTAWQKVIELAPKSDAATAARDNLEQLDVKQPDDPKTAAKSEKKK